MSLVGITHLIGRLQQGLVICASLASVGCLAASANAADCQGTLTKLSACTRDADKIAIANPKWR